MALPRAAKRRRRDDPTAGWAPAVGRAPAAAGPLRDRQADVLPLVGRAVQSEVLPGSGDIVWREVGYQFFPGSQVLLIPGGLRSHAPSLERLDQGFERRNLRTICS